MNDKNNFIPRHGSPLFYPQDLSEGFQGSSGGLNRRKFLKRTGGATAATFLAWQASSQRSGAVVIKETTSGEMEYTLHCLKNPDANDAPKAYAHGAVNPDPAKGTWRATHTQPWDSGDDAVTVSVFGDGPVVGAKADSFLFVGRMSAWHNDDFDDGNSGDDELGGDTQHQAINQNIGQGTLRITKDTNDEIIVEWIDPNIAFKPVTVEAADTDGLTDDSLSMVCAGVVFPTAITAVAVVNDGGSTHAFGMNAGIEKVGEVGLKYSVADPGGKHNAMASLNWTIEVVGRKRGSGDEWKSYGSASNYMSGVTIPEAD